MSEDNVVRFPGNTGSLEQCIAYIREVERTTGVKTLIFVGVDGEGHMLFGHMRQTAVELLFAATYLKSHVINELREHGILP